jgi:hypothetical protein
LLGFFSPVTSSARILKYFEANFLNAVTMAFEMCLKRGQHLTQFGRRRIGIDQNAPLCAIDRPGLDGASQRARNEAL